MVFRRKHKLGWWQSARQLFYHKGGWSRALSYIGHRMSRLKDSPHKVSRGIAAGVFVCFTPFFGFHFFLAAVIAFIIRGNVLSAILATFFGNPLTFPFISWGSLRLGTFLLGRDFSDAEFKSSRNSFNEVMYEIYENIKSIFTSKVSSWQETLDFINILWSNIFEFINIFLLPYLVGGLIPGFMFAILFYFASVPIISVYQNRRKGRLRQKWVTIRERAVKVKGVVDYEDKEP